jgi:hypothetical protein
VATDRSGWQRLTADSVAELPEGPAVFEVGNLVRTVIMIGTAGGNLRARLGAILHEPTRCSSSAGGYYFRYATSTDEAADLATRVAAYRAAHRGQLPPGHGDTPRVLRVVPRSAA